MDTNELDRMLGFYFPDGGWQWIEMQGSGMNNTTRFVEASGERYVLRVYETHRDAEKVLYEHAVLTGLAESDLPFKIPLPVRSSEGQTVVRTSDGKLAALFRYIEGRTPSLSERAALRSFGGCIARLSTAMADLKIDLAPAYRPYYDIEHTHPRCGIDELTRFCLDPSEEFKSDEILQALEAIALGLDSFRLKLPDLKALPHQLIHGDLNASNALADPDGKITAILDFEFVTRDLRVMELAVCLSDLIRPEHSDERMWTRIEALVEGYASHGILTKDEIDTVPTLLLLRRLDVFIHFLGRYWDRVDGIQVVNDQIQNAYAMMKWLEAHEEKLLASLQCLIAPSTQRWYNK